MTTEDERMRFEVCAKSLGMDLLRILYSYSDENTNRAWAVWQAALSARPAPQEVDQVMELVNRLDASAATDGRHDHHPSVGTEQIYESVKQAIATLVQDRDEWKEATESANERFKLAERKLAAQPSPAAVEPVAQQQPTSPDVHDALLFCLWHHQGGSSKIGQPIRAALGIGEFDRLTDDQLAAAKRIQSAITSQPLPQEREPLTKERHHAIMESAINGKSEMGDMEYVAWIIDATERAHGIREGS